MSRRPVAQIIALLAALLCAVSSPSTLAQGTPTAATGEQRERLYSGEVELGAARLAFSVRFQPFPDGDGYVATLDVPAQGIDGAPLQDVSIGDEEVTFTLGPPANARFTGRFVEPGVIEGEMSQAGAKFAFRMRRAEAGEETGPRRPQHPKPPFPYQVREVVYRNAEAGVELAGTLTLPEGEGPFPVALMLTGSGPQDRDETLFGHKPFLVIADHLTRRGIGVLRVDDRGVGGSTGSTMDSTLRDFASDAQAGLDFLRSLDSVDGDRLGLIGHSEGGTIAPMIGARDERLAFMILLAATALPGDELLMLQIETIQTTMGLPEDQRTESLSAQRRILDALLAIEADGSAPSREDLAERLRPLVEEAMAPLAPSESALEQQVEASLSQLSSPWFRSFLAYDPRTHLREVDEAVLAINGSLDVQVPADENLRVIERTLREAPTEDITVIELPGLNHLFQAAETGLMQEYGQIEQTFSPTALRIMGDWLADRLLD